MDDSITIDELVENLDVRHRLSLTLTPDDVPPAVGEAFALQLASVGTNGDSPADPLHVGVGIKQPFPPGHTFRALETILEKDVAVLPGEATDFGGALGTVVDGEVRRRHITDPDVQVTVLSGVEFVADRLQTALGRAMSTGTV